MSDSSRGLETLNSDGSPLLAAAIASEPGAARKMVKMEGETGQGNIPARKCEAACRTRRIYRCFDRWPMD